MDRKSVLGFPSPGHVAHRRKPPCHVESHQARMRLHVAVARSSTPNRATERWGP